MNRRFFLLAAPAIVAAPSLMKVSAFHIPEVLESTRPDSVWQFPIMPASIRNKLLFECAKTNAILQRCLYGKYDGYILGKTATIRLTF
jgi:hypothetical protein